VTYFMAHSLWLGTSHTRTPRIDRGSGASTIHLWSCRCYRVCAGGEPDHQPEGAAESSEIHRARPAGGALAGAFDEPAQRKAAIKVFWTALTRPRTVLKALELAGRLAGELYGPWRRVRPYNNLAGRRWELVAVS
jgi:hypothetical protein